MSIPMKKYIAITSAVANTEQAARKDLIARVFTTNPLFAANTVYEFASSSDVAAFAGSSSIEASLAAAYFGWISKTANQPQKISFMRYSFEAIAPFIYSTNKITPLAAFKAITDGSMTINLGGVAYSITGVDLSSVEDYAGVAATLQTAIRTNTEGGALYTNATVEYQPSNTSFVLTGGEAGANDINFATAGAEGTDLSSLVGWNIASAPVVSNGTKEATITDILNKTIDISTNFLTFGFINPADAYNNLDAIGAWVDEQNNQYRLSFDLGNANYSEGIATASKYSGMTAQYNINYGIEGLVPAWLMSCILPATTNYENANAVKNYMYQEFSAFPISVGNDDGTLYQTLDGLNINYNGQTQKSGKTIAFYQNGFNTDGTDTAIFDNEAWLKDAISTEMLNAFLGLDFMSADTDGMAIMTGVLEGVADEALNNHVFGNTKTLTTTQKAYITQLTGNNEAWLDLQTKRYLYDVNIATESSNNSTVYVGEYTLFYLKNDVIRKVKGRDILI